MNRYPLDFAASSHLSVLSWQIHARVGLSDEYQGPGDNRIRLVKE